MRPLGTSCCGQPNLELTGVPNATLLEKVDVARKLRLGVQRPAAWKHGEHAVDIDQLHDRPITAPFLGKYESICLEERFEERLRLEANWPVASSAESFDYSRRPDRTLPLLVYLDG